MNENMKPGYKQTEVGQMKNKGFLTANGSSARMSYWMRRRKK